MKDDNKAFEEFWEEAVTKSLLTCLEIEQMKPVDKMALKTIAKRAFEAGIMHEEGPERFDLS